MLKMHTHAAKLINIKLRKLLVGTWVIYFIYNYCYHEHQHINYSKHCMYSVVHKKIIQC